MRSSWRRNVAEGGEGGGQRGREILGEMIGGEQCGDLVAKLYISNWNPYAETI